MREPFTAKMLEFREIAPDVRHFLFEVQNVDSFSFVPGQFVSFTAEIAGSNITRAYSMAAPPCGSGRFELCLNRVADGKFSNYLFEMRPGDCIPMTGPWGSFIFRPPVRDSVLVATGAGVVPFRAMLEDQLEKTRFTNSHCYLALVTNMVCCLLRNSRNYPANIPSSTSYRLSAVPMLAGRAAPPRAAASI